MILNYTVRILGSGGCQLCFGYISIEKLIITDVTGSSVDISFRMQSYSGLKWSFRSELYKPG